MDTTDLLRFHKSIKDNAGSDVVSLVPELIPHNKVYIVKASAVGDRNITHELVAVDDGETFWIVGDGESVYKALDSKYNHLVYSRLDQTVLGEPAWMDGKPW